MILLYFLPSLLINTCDPAITHKNGGLSNVIPPSVIDSVLHEYLHTPLQFLQRILVS